MCFRSNFDLPHEPKIFYLCKLGLVHMGKMNQNESDVFSMVRRSVIDN